jgi:type III restriction enzyme
MAKTIDKLIINSPFEEPASYWSYERETREFSIAQGRRPAGYVRATPGSRSFDDPGEFFEIELVNAIRPRIKSWREDGYPGVTAMTRRLLKHWLDPLERTDKQFFFCQLEAIETLIWLKEAPANLRTGIEIPGDGGAFPRWLNKMATGTGKTVVMAMILAWQFLNKVSSPTDSRFSRNALIVAPGLTVKSRLQVLLPSHPQNYYEEFNVVPSSLMERLRQGKLRIINWHMLAWDTQEKINAKIEKGTLRSVDKRKHIEISDEAYIRQVLGDMASVSNLIVINDEAHHAWRINPEAAGKYQRLGEIKDSAEEATVWVGGLDRIHRARRILQCFDLTATPFAPSGKQAEEEALFPWIVSDFGLNDAIESGLVKTPRVVIRDDSYRTKDFMSRLYHIYNDPEVKTDLSRKAEESEELPQLLLNAYYLLGSDWLAAKKDWEKGGHTIPPVMITVANRTETAARIRYAFDHQQILIPELCETDKILHIDSKVLAEAESRIEALDLSLDSDDDNNAPRLSKKEQSELLRRMVDTIGRPGEPGEQVQNVISVGMLSEGWDAKTVTHIMGLRAFSSQLLAEQVIGRGLRRVSYDAAEDGLYAPEYVNIFGVPFTFLPHESVDGPPPPPPVAKTRIEPLSAKSAHQIDWPNVLRIDHIYAPILKLDWQKVKPLLIDPFNTITEAEMAAIIAGKPNEKVKAALGMEAISQELRLQTLIFKIAASLYNRESQKQWRGSREEFLIQLIHLVEDFIRRGKIDVENNLFFQDDAKRRVILMMNMSTILRHIWGQIEIQNTLKRIAVFDTEKPIRSTSDMRPWLTSKPCESSNKCHISHTVYDSTWEASEAWQLDHSPQVRSFVKNDHLGFKILYHFGGVIHAYLPDYLIRLTNGKMLVLEVKGQDSDQNKAKRDALAEWVLAVNEHGGFGDWDSAVSFHPGDLAEILDKKGGNH